jgi:site-specific recombinase XerD
VQFNRFCVVRQLCEHIAQTDPRCHVPEPMKCVAAQKTFCPYIFNKQEIEALLSAALALSAPESLRPHTYRTFFGLLYTTGIRIGEAFALALKDFHGERDLLYIAEGKFRKARWVPLHPSTSQMLKQYFERRLRIGPRTSDSPLALLHSL